IVAAAGNLPKKIAEFIGRVNSGTSAVSVAQMTSPAGWQEPGQTPDFDEYTGVLKGKLSVETRTANEGVEAGQGDVAPRGRGRRGRRSSRRKASGCGIARQMRRAPNISRCACRGFHRIRFIGISKRSRFSFAGSVAFAALPYRSLTVAASETWLCLKPHPDGW